MWQPTKTSDRRVVKWWPVALVALTLAACREDAAAQEAAKPTIYVLTSLPLVFDEGFALGPAQGEAAKFLRRHYIVKSIDLPSQLPPGAMLFAAQPRALPAEELVALDAWVRGGGKLLLLADPMLEWQSQRPIGDRLRPPVQYADTGLLQHWGLRLDAPDRTMFDTTGVRRSFIVGAFTIGDSDPGTLKLIEGRGCVVEAAGAIARCAIGNGRATIIADADFLNVGDGEVSPGNGDNLPFLSSELAQLSESR